MRKKLVQINTVCNGSTGNIMRQIQIAAEEKGYDAISFFGRRKGYPDLHCERFGNSFGFWMHVIWTTLTDRQGLFSYFITKRMIRRLRAVSPDIIHLHNLHGYYLNYPLLFEYLRKEYGGKIIWTFHDCWPITGHCAYFTRINCNKWKVQCNRCPNKGVYPISWGLDSSKYNYMLKKKLFSDFKNMIIVCPSQWMQNIAKNSFLKDIKSVVVSNGIDLAMFYPRNSKEALEKYKIPKNKKIILGVASIWEERKGLDIFLKLASKISEDYIIVLVGLNKVQMKKLPPNIIGIKRTENQNELAELYTWAEVFLNPSEEESFSLVTIEAMACGTPVVALDSSAVKELIHEENGVVLHEPVIQDYIKALEECSKKKENVTSICGSVSKYSWQNMTKKILELYE